VIGRSDHRVVTGLHSLGGPCLLEEEGAVVHRCEGQRLLVQERSVTVLLVIKDSRLEARLALCVSVMSFTRHGWLAKSSRDRVGRDA